MSVCNLHIKYTLSTYYGKKLLMNAILEWSHFKASQLLYTIYSAQKIGDLKMTVNHEILACIFVNCEFFCFKVVDILLRLYHMLSRIQMSLFPTFKDSHKWIYLMLKICVIMKIHPWHPAKICAENSSRYYHEVTL